MQEAEQERKTEGRGKMKHGSLSNPKALHSGKIVEILIENPKDSRKNLRPFRLTFCSVAISYKAVPLLQIS